MENFGAFACLFSIVCLYPLPFLVLGFVWARGWRLRSPLRRPGEETETALNDIDQIYQN